MAKPTFDDLQSFIAIVQEGSFTRAAVKLGVSQSALSHAMRALEARLGVRLLTRTTRSVAPTALGERLLQNIGPRFQEIENELKQIVELRDKPAGVIRITASDLAVQSVIWPKLIPFLKQYPEVRVELDTDNANADIVSDRYDAGVRMGEDVAKDMISVRIGPEMRFAVIAAPEYFARRKLPKHPQDLTDHLCINLRLLTHRNNWAWEFEGPDGELRVRVDGQLVFNNIYQVLDGALEGFGIAYVPESLALPYLEQGRLTRVLKNWCPVWAGFHLYYPSRRQSLRAMTLLVEALRYHDPNPPPPGQKKRARK